MKSWKSYLLWEGLPFLLLLFIFGFISAVNWDYEKKLVSIRNNSALDWTNAHLGPILLAMAFGLASFASLILFLIRYFRRNEQVDWVMFACLIPISILFIFPSLFIVVLAPAAITMMEQMEIVPNSQR